jgi:cytidylate kinase
MEKIYMSKVVAIDGPAGAGKSTVARLLAERCGFTYVNTGSLYRAIAWAAAGKGVDIKDLQEDFLAGLDLDYVDGKLLVNGVDPGEELRSSACSAAASFVATQPRVRQFLLPVQRNAAMKGWIVMEGRDIGSVIFPDAAYKFFVTASVEERARRRLEQNANETLTFEEIKKLISERDYQDSHRAEAPLRQAEDALLVDTSSMSIDEVVAYLCDYISQNPREC